MRTISVTVIAIFSRVAFWKLLDHSYVQSPLSTNTRHIDNSILKDALKFFILRTWSKIRVKSFIKTSVNFTETRIDEGAWRKIVTQSVHLEEHCTKIETTFHLFYALLFFTNLVFKFNIVLIGIFSDNFNHNLLFAFSLTVYISLILKFIQCLTLFFLRNSKILMRLGVLFLKVFSFKMLKLCSYFFHENCLLSNGENYSWR